PDCADRRCEGSRGLPALARQEPPLERSENCRAGGRPEKVSNPKEGSDRIDYQETPDDITEVHAAVEREKPEPSADVTPMPMWLTGLCAAATVWAGIYFGIFNGGLNGNVYNEYESSPAVLFPLPPKASTGEAAAQTLTLAQQGKSVYAGCA